jgi:hypothetical protein
VSQVGNVVGNVGSAIYPLFQIYETFHGKVAPKGRAIMGAAASLSLGLIPAAIMHNTLWGVQNIIGGLTLLAPLLIGGLVSRVRGSGLKETAMIAAAALAVSVGAFYADAATLPRLFAAVFSAGVISNIVLAVQWATGAMFMWMYLPNVVKILRGRAVSGFTPAFDLMFALSGVGSMIWALPSAWIFNDAHQGSYRLIFAVNTVYAVSSLISYWSARRKAKRG